MIRICSKSEHLRCIGKFWKSLWTLWWIKQHPWNINSGVELFWGGIVFLVQKTKQFYDGFDKTVLSPIGVNFYENKHERKLLIVVIIKTNSKNDQAP